MIDTAQALHASNSYIRVEIANRYVGEVLYNDFSKPLSERKELAIYPKPKVFYEVFIHNDSYPSKRIVYIKELEEDQNKNEAWYIGFANYLTTNIVFSYPSQYRHEILYGYCKEELLRLDSKRFHNKKLRLVNGAKIILINHIGKELELLKLKNGFADQHNRHLVDIGR